jgi:hypothetical protein
MVETQRFETGGNLRKTPARIWRRELREWPMNDASDKRHHIRYRIPLSTVLPELSGEAIDVEDISEGGFKVVVSKKPEEGSVIEGTLHRSGTIIGRFFGRVVWLSENVNQPPSWTIGVSMDVHGGDESRLADEMQAAINMVG